MTLRKTPTFVEKGVYEFEVLKAISSTSKKSNEMIIVTMRITKKGKSYIVTDYMTESYKYGQHIIDFFKSANKKEVLDKESFNTDDFLNSKGLANVGTLVYKGKTRPRILNYLSKQKRIK